MIKRSSQNQAEKVKTGFWLSSQDKTSKIFFYLLILFLPTQLGKHFWPDFSFITGLRIDYLSPTIYFTDVLVFLIFIFSINNLSKKLRELLGNYFLPISVLIISLLIGVIFSKNPASGFLGLIKLAEFSYLAFYVANNFIFLKKSIVFACFFIASLFEVFLSFAQLLNGGSINNIFYFLGERTFNSQTPGIANASINGELFLRPYATFSHPNVLAGYLVFALIFMLYLRKEKYQIFLIIFSLALFSITLYLTLSRVAAVLYVLILFILFCISIFKKYKNKLTRIIFTILFSSLSFVVFLAFNKNIFLQRFLQISLSDESLDQRIKLVNLSFEMFRNSPVIGVGVNNFLNNLDLSYLYKQTFFIQPVHNIFLLILSQTGLVGFLFFTFILYKCVLKILFEKQKEKVYLWFIFLSIVFLGLFDHYLLTIQQGQLLLVLSLGLIISHKTDKHF